LGNLLDGAEYKSPFDFINAIRSRPQSLEFIYLMPATDIYGIKNWSGARPSRAYVSRLE